MEDDQNQSDVVVLDETLNDEEKENQYIQNSEPDTLLEPQVEISWESNMLHNSESAISPIENQPQDPQEDEQVKVKIKDLENKIAECKRQITLFDEAEVDLDSNNSYYILSHK